MNRIIVNKFARHEAGIVVSRFCKRLYRSNKALALFVMAVWYGHRVPEWHLE